RSGYRDSKGDPLLKPQFEIGAGVGEKLDIEMSENLLNRLIEINLKRGGVNWLAETKQLRRQLYVVEHGHFRTFIQRGRTLRRGKTLTRPERFQVPEPMLNGQAERKSLDAWVVFSRVVTFWAPSFVLRKLGFPHDDIIQAWREKIALCFIISLICATVAFLTLGLPYAFCPESLRQDVGDRLMAIGPASGSKLSPPGYYIVNQGIYFSTNPRFPIDFTANHQSTQIPDISSYFRRPAGYDRACTKISLPRNVKFEAVEFDPCSAENGNDGCRFEPIAQVADQLNLQLRSKAGKPLRAGYSWKEVKPDLP
ncbi:hypothetical protein L0F63_006718, partial [Massospora cicadina]